MAEWLALTPNHKIVGSSPAKSSRLIKNRPAWATGDDNGASVHSAANEYLAIDRDGNCASITRGALKRVIKWVYTPQGVEQVTDITGLPGIKCKALWASFGKKKGYVRTPLSQIAQ